MAATDSEKRSGPSKTFIINHMNADHQDSLALYLQVYNRVAARDAQSARLEDVTVNDLLITANGTRYTVPFTPPLTSLSEIRPRVVAMHQECLQRLGISDIPIRSYRPPRGIVQPVIFAVCLATYISFSSRTNFEPGSLFYETVGLERAKRFARFCYDIQPLLLPAMVGIHIFEAVMLAVTRLKRHRVPVLSGLWCAWMVSTFIEGFGAFRRIDQMVREEEAKRRGGKTQ